MQTEPISKIAEDFCKRFIDAGLIEDTPENYGAIVLQATYDKPVIRVLECLSTFLFGELKPIHCDVFDDFCNMTIIGDGNCQVCGGTLEPYDSEEREIPSGDYDIPPTYKVTKYIYKCPVCGQIIQSETEL